MNASQSGDPSALAATLPVNAPILIVGAGPTGLNLALSLALRRIPFRIIDEHDGPGRESRAMGVHARTLEFYQQFGIAAEVVSQGLSARRGHAPTKRAVDNCRSWECKEQPRSAASAETASNLPIFRPI